MSEVKRKELKVCGDSLIFRSFTDTAKRRTISVESVIRIETAISVDEALKIMEFFVIEFDMKIEKKI